MQAPTSARVLGGVGGGIAAGVGLPAVSSSQGGEPSVACAMADGSPPDELDSAPQLSDGGAAASQEQRDVRAGTGNPYEALTALQRVAGSPVLVVDTSAADGTVRIVMVSDAGEARRVLADASLPKGPQTSEPFLSIVPQHLIAIEGPVHARLRKVATSVLNDQVRGRLSGIALRHSRALVGQLRGRSAGRDMVVRDLDRLVRAMALDTISEGIFGAPWGAIADYSPSNEKAHALAELMYVLHARVTDLSDRRWRVPGVRGGDEDKAATWRRVLVPFVRSEIGSARAGTSAADCMLREWIGHDPSLSDDELENLCLTFLTMGHENVSTAIAWTLVQLAENPIAQERVREQVGRSSFWRKECAGELNGEAGVFGALAELTLVEQAFLESSRLFPSVPVVSRMATTDTTVAGYRIPAGTEIVLNLYGLNRDTEAWGEDAARFACPRSKTIKLDDPSYWSFGAGARPCVGRPLSGVESKAVIASLLMAFSLSSASDRKVQPNNLVSLRLGNHAIRFTPLSSATINCRL